MEVSQCVLQFNKPIHFQVILAPTEQEETQLLNWQQRAFYHNDNFIFTGEKRMFRLRSFRRSKLFDFLLAIRFIFS